MVALARAPLWRVCNREPRGARTACSLLVCTAPKASAAAGSALGADLAPAHDRPDLGGAGPALRRNVRTPTTSRGRLPYPRACEVSQASSNPLGPAISKIAAVARRQSALQRNVAKNRLLPLR